MFIAEPVQGAGGVIFPPDDYFPESVKSVISMRFYWFPTR
ncbi:MAG: hypothetical protein CM1200mP41_11870 [Gammaproteobacteria bacterium]|nr:MAG: hypothetical protein CM1200mP41_11870 [Gammaproteobacteria bacterium]